MKCRHFVFCALLSLLSFTAAASAQMMPIPMPEPAPAAATPAAPAAIDTTGLAGFAETMSDRFGKMKFDDLYDPAFWVAFGKDAVYWLVSFIPRLIVATFLLCLFWLIYRTVRKVLLGGMKAAGVDESIRDMLGMLLKWGILGFGLIIAGNQVGIQIAALLTGVSIIGLAIGFASQETLSNFIAGIMIFWDKPFKVGDWIVVDGDLGQVKRVTFRSTRLENMDGDIVVLPNMKMLSEKVINKSTNEITRANVVVGIAYKESIEDARRVLLELVSRDKRILSTPEPEVVVNNLGASSVDLLLRFWIREEKYEDAMQHEYMERAKLALDNAGIEIPFPHMQLFVEKTPPLGEVA
ncbi:MAG TPA: mechanosensitive ion channel [Tepidisphaeraceae bacterium]|jgi:small conductance mechanosensitive channel